MQANDLDTAYTALAEAIGSVGESHAQLMLATLSLSLVAKMDNLEMALILIKQAEKLTKEKS